MGEPGIVETEADGHDQPRVTAPPGSRRDDAADDQPVIEGPPGGPTRAWLVARVLLGIGLLLLVLSLVGAFRPVENPGVQDCGGAVPFLVRGGDNRVVHLGDTGEPEEGAHARQPTCRERALDEVGRSGRLFVAFLVITGIGAVVGLVDDHLALRREPRFESLLRDLPVEGQARRGLVPRVTAGELVARLPAFERPEVAGIAFWGAVAFVALPLAGPWDATRAALADIRWLPLVLVVPAVVASWVAAAALRHGLSPGGREPKVFWPRAVLEAVAGDWQAALRPLTGSSGLDLYRLRRRGVPGREALAAVQVLVTVALVLHLALLAPVALVVAHDPHPPTVVKEPQLILIAVVLSVVVVGLWRLRTRWRGLPVRPSWRAFEQFDRLAPQSGTRLASIGLTLAQPLLRAAVLALVLAAYGAAVPPEVILLVALAGPVMVALAPTPGGSGVVEALTMLLLMLVAGVDPGRAAAVALTVRLMTFWLPLVPGFAATRRLGPSGSPRVGQAESAPVTAAPSSA